MGSITCCICLKLLTVVGYVKLKASIKAEHIICNKHSEEVCAKYEEYKTKRKESYLKRKRRLASKRRRARENRAAGSHTDQEWTDLCSKYGNKCICCKKELPLTKDHVKSLARGGSNYISNLQPLCRRCNSSKGTKEIDYRTK